MKEQVFDLEKWKNSNLDLIVEALEKNKKAIVLIAGASSSGKSFVAKVLADYVTENNLKTLSISTDSYNRGISHIIVDKVNDNHFGYNLAHIDELKQIARESIINLDFDKKFDRDCLVEIGKKSAKYFENSLVLQKYLKALHTEFSKINFDETTVYDLTLAATDVHNLANGQTIMEKDYSKKISEQKPTNIFVCGNDYDVVILEGIYALDQKVTDILHGSNVITNFVEADEKTLFIRRILRDKMFAPTTFTIKNYFNAVLPAYKRDIQPKAEKADIVFFNNMSFKELREGEHTSVHKRIKVQDSTKFENFVKQCKILSKIIFKDHYIGTANNIDESELIFRSASFDNGQTFSPYSLVQKGHQKLRKDGKIIRPVNLFLSEGQMKQTFASEKEFFDMLAPTEFAETKLVIKQRTRLQYKNHFITVDQIKNDGTYVELNSLDLQKENLVDFTTNTNVVENDKQSA